MALHDQRFFVLALRLITLLFSCRLVRAQPVNALISGRPYYQPLTMALRCQTQIDHSNRTEPVASVHLWIKAQYSSKRKENYMMLVICSLPMHILPSGIALPIISRAFLIFFKRSLVSSDTAKFSVLAQS